jgi:hypothetical protein
MSLGLIDRSYETERIVMACGSTIFLDVFKDEKDQAIPT